MGRNASLERERRDGEISTYLPDIVKESPERAEVPDIPAGLPGELGGLWVEVWTAPVARLLDAVSDLAGMTRLFRLYADFDAIEALFKSHDEHQCEAEKCRVEPLLSKMRVKIAISGECRQLEQQYGLSPRSRLSMGLALLAEGRRGGSLDEASEDDDDE